MKAIWRKRPVHPPLTAPLRIAMVGAFGFHPNKTMRVRALPLARALHKWGCTVKIFMPPWQTPAEADRSWEEDGIAIRYVPLHGGTLGITRRLIREINAWHPSLVYGFKPKAYAGLVAWWFYYTQKQVPLVVDTDDWEGWGGWNDRAPYTRVQKHFFAWQEQWGMRHCDLLTVASRELERLARKSGVQAEKIVYLPNGTGIGRDAVGAVAKREALGLQDRPVLLLYSRLFEFDTGRLVRILQQVHHAIPDLAVLSVGAGLYDEEAAVFHQQRKDAGLSQAFIDVGWLEEAALPAVLAVADVGIYLMEDTLLNRTKCPVKLADMLYVGVPVVGEAVGQVTEYVVDHQTGVTCAVGDETALAQALISLLKDPLHRAELSHNAMQHIETHFSWENAAAKLLHTLKTPPLHNPKG